MSGDLRKINRDFGTTINVTKAVNLFNMAATRGVATNGRSLEAMAHCIIGVPMDKGLQISNWNHYPLSLEQKHYAAKDAKYSLEIYECLEKLQELTSSPELSTIRPGLEVDIAQYSGKRLT